MMKGRVREGKREKRENKDKRKCINEYVESNVESKRRK